MAKYLRVLGCVFFQGRFQAPAVDMAGKTVVVTGPSPGGIGAATASALGALGARVILGARNIAKTEAVAAGIPGAVLLPLDLADPASVAGFAELVERELRGAALDVLVCNAGATPTDGHSVTAGGVERTFRVCALGHFALMRRLRAARVVSVTGDIYALAHGPADPFLPPPGRDAYERACLGRLQLLGELKARGAAPAANAEFVAVHPGVVSTGLMGPPAAAKPLMDALFLTAEQGAQASVYAATAPAAELHQEWDIPYFHNKRGWVRLPDTDLAMDAPAAARLYDQCEQLCGLK